MIPELLLLIVFGITAIISKVFRGNWNLTFSGNLAMAAMLFITALGHFMFTQGMVMMMPPFLPLKKELVYFTGVAEFLLGLALLTPRFRYSAGVIVIVLFVLMLPANIYGAINHIDLEKANHEGNGPDYLWFRIPLQIFFIGWVYYFSIKKRDAVKN